jgi:hypothetical protein
MPKEDLALFKMALKAGNMDVANEIIKDFIDNREIKKKVV